MTEALLLLSLNHLSALTRPLVASFCPSAVVLALFKGRGSEESEILRIKGLWCGESIGDHMQFRVLPLPRMFGEWRLGSLFFGVLQFRTWLR